LKVLSTNQQRGIFTFPLFSDLALSSRFFLFLVAANHHHGGAEKGEGPWKKKEKSKPVDFKNDLDISGFLREQIHKEKKKKKKKKGEGDPRVGRV
jgi:hypothetical protein